MLKLWIIRGQGGEGKDMLEAERKGKEAVRRFLTHLLVVSLLYYIDEYFIFRILFLPLCICIYNFPVHIYKLHNAWQVQAFISKVLENYC